MQLLLLTTVAFFLLLFSAKAQTTGDYRSKATGNWNSTSTWQYYNGSSWVNATATPASTNGAITILSSHTVTNTTNLSIDQVVVESGGILIQNNGTLTIADGSGNDLTVYGNMVLNAQTAIDNNATLFLYGRMDKNAGGFTIGTGGKVNVENGGWFKRAGGSMDATANRWVVKSGGTYEHADDGGTNLPLADWQANSTCLVSSSIPPGNLDQSFYHLTWNAPGQTLIRTLGSALRTVAGDLNIISTGSGGIILTGTSNQSLTVSGNFNQSGGNFSICEGGGWIMNVGGNFTQTGGSFKMADNTSSAAPGTPTLNVSGSFSLSNGTFDASQYTGSNASLGIGTINIAGNMTIGTGGIFTETSTTAGKGIVNFNGTTLQTFIKTGTVSNTINFNVLSGALLDVGNEVITGSGNFATNTGSTLYIGSAQGIATTGSTGNIQVSGTRFYNALASYIYKGSTAQATGNGLPVVVKDVTINNVNGVTMSVYTTITGNLSLTNGVFTTSSTNSLTLDAAATISGGSATSYINGPLIHTVATTATTTKVFPIGKANAYRPVTLTVTHTNTTSTTYTAEMFAGAPPSRTKPGNISHISSVRYYSINRSNSTNLSSATVRLTYGADDNVLSVPNLHIVKSNGSSTWVDIGGTVTTPGSITSASFTSFSDFVLADDLQDIVTPLKWISFGAAKKTSSVELNWVTVNEVNTENFVIEKSRDGNTWTAIGTVSSNNKDRNSYSFTDHATLSTSLYRIRQNDKDGKYTYSATVQVSAGGIVSTGMSISPNPVTGSAFNVRVSDDDILSGKEVIIKVMDMTGRIVSLYKTAPASVLSLQHGLSQPGMYVVQVQNSNKTLVSKVMVQ